jgi:DNA-binding PadR family transcriptional regulator
MICLYERPMHPYEVSTTLRQRQKHESIRLNYGSLYAVVDSLEKRGLITAKGTERSGRLPERTIYELTDAGHLEMHDWLTELMSTPVNDYPGFGAALTFLPALAPDDVVALLKERAQRLEFQLAEMASSRELVEKRGLPRLFWIEAEFHKVLREAELRFVLDTVDEIETGTLDGLTWWREIHEHPDATALHLSLLEEKGWTS